MLPVSFPEALDALEADETIRAAMGEELVSTFLGDIKRYEVDRYRRYVTDWDMERNEGVGWIGQGAERRGKSDQSC